MTTAVTQLITNLLDSTTPIVESNPRTRVVSLSASSPAIDLALDLAAGALPDVSWCIVGEDGNDCAFLALAAQRGMSGAPIVLAFDSTYDRDFLIAIATYDSFALLVEGTIPVRIPIRRDDDALRPWLRSRGWL